MKKIRLEVDALAVESFDAGAARPLRGTVHGRHTHDAYCPELPPPDDSINVCPVPTAAATCNNTCANTCGSTCGCGGGVQTFGNWTCYASPCTDPNPGTVDINAC